MNILFKLNDAGCWIPSSYNDINGIVTMEGRVFHCVWQLLVVVSCVNSLPTIVSFVALASWNIVFIPVSSHKNRKHYFDGFNFTRKKTCFISCKTRKHKIANTLIATATHATTATTIITNNDNSSKPAGQTCIALDPPFPSFSYAGTQNAALS